MDSKRQSKLPDGLGKKIIQALKSQDGPGQPAQEFSATGPVESYSSPQILQPPPGEHGLETISHMDFGSQEMHYDDDSSPLETMGYQSQAPGPLEPTEFSSMDDSGIPDLESLTVASNAPQYGSFAPVEQEIPQDYSQQTYDQQMYEQSTDDFDYNQQTYDDFDTGYDPQAGQAGEIPDYQPPQLGTPAPNYQVAARQPEMEEVAAPQMDQYNQEFTEYEPYDNQSYTEYEAPPVPGAPQEEFDHYAYQAEGYNQNIPGAQYDPDGYQQDPSSYDDYTEESVQIGYSQQSIIDSYEPPADTDHGWDEPQHDHISTRGPDLDSVQPHTEPHYSQPKEPSRSPLDLDYVEPDSYRRETGREAQRPSPPVKPGPPIDDRSYREPPGGAAIADERDYRNLAEEHYRSDERSRHEPPRDPYREERPRKEVPRDYYRDERLYHEPPREHYREERSHHEAPRDYYRDERSHHEPVRDYYRDERPYHEPSRDYYRDERLYHDTPRGYSSRGDKAALYPEMTARGEHVPERKAELFNSNVETLIKLVSTLPPGVTRQTGAQIIRQTMEAMGISMSDVLSDAQGAQARLQKYMKDNFNRIEEYKLLIRQLEDDIHYYQRKAKELDDLISLFILADKDKRGL